jgi:hypothetical protein
LTMALKDSDGGVSRAAAEALKQMQQA